MTTVLERFLNYVSIDTQSDGHSDTCPSTDKQLDLAKVLFEEMKAMGLEDVILDDNGYLSATLPSNVDHDLPTIGFIAHMDTSPDFSGKDVKPLIHDAYDGQDLLLNEALDIVMKIEDFPNLKKYKGQTIITTDGTTLLGADNKAGIAEILSAMAFLIDNPHIQHGCLKVGFTPDEEIGRGADKFDVEGFGADFAYTIDGGELGGIEFENFNAANAQVTIYGRNIHPGSAKNKMVNAVLIGMELANMLPQAQRPEHTEMYEGFTHINDFNGSVEKSEMVLILRDHDLEAFEQKKATLVAAVDYLNCKYGAGTLVLDLKDSYFNMREKVLEIPHVIDTAKEAMVLLDIEPITHPVRGGTDGARLSYMGLITPNIFTGGGNFHGRYEFIVKESMEKAVEVIVKIAELYTRK